LGLKVALSFAHVHALYIPVRDVILELTKFLRFPGISPVLVKMCDVQYPFTLQIMTVAQCWRNNAGELR